MLDSCGQIYKRKELKQNVAQTKQKLAVPDFYDWRDKGVVNPIKDQGDCGSCYAFAAIATSESAYAITSGELLQFSEQNIIDCGPCLGCFGGWSNSAAYYIINHQNGQFNSESDYPYTASQGADCLFDSSKAIGKITNIIGVEKGNEIDLRDKIAQYGVASVSIAANNAPFMSYTGGILDNDLCTELTRHLRHDKIRQIFFLFGV